MTAVCIGSAVLAAAGNPRRLPGDVGHEIVTVRDDAVVGHKGSPKPEGGAAAQRSASWAPLGEGLTGPMGSPLQCSQERRSFNLVEVVDQHLLVKRQRPGVTE